MSCRDGVFFLGPVGDAVLCIGGYNASPVSRLYTHYAMSTTPTALLDRSKRREYWLGFFLAAMGAVLFSAKSIPVKLTYQYGVDALTVIGFRMMFALPVYLMVAVYYLVLARQGKVAGLTWRDAGRVVLLGFIGYYLSSYLNFLGLQYISAGLERLILFLSPTFVLFMSAFWLKRKITGLQWTALVISYFGVILVFVQDMAFNGHDVLLGSAFVFAAAFTSALYLVGSGEVVSKVGATRLAAYAMTVSSVITMIHFFCVHGVQGLEQVTPVYQLSLIHAVLNTVFPTFMIMWAVARIGAPMTSQLGLLGPVSVLFLAAWILGEPITSLQLAGTVFVLSGMVVLGRSRARQAG